MNEVDCLMLERAIIRLAKAVEEGAEHLGSIAQSLSDIASEGVEVKTKAPLRPIKSVKKANA